jgi:hypothetical protein
MRSPVIEPERSRTKQRLMGERWLDEGAIGLPVSETLTIIVSEVSAVMTDLKGSTRHVTAAPVCA